MKKQTLVLAAMTCITMALTACSSGNTATAADKTTAATTTADTKAGETKTDDSKAAETTKAGETKAAEETKAAGGVLVMATNAEFPPYEYHEGGKIVGIDAEIAAAIADKLGMELRIDDMQFDSIIPAIQSGKADLGLAGMTVDETRLKSVDFSDTYAEAAQVIIVKKDSPIASPDDLSGKKVGVQLGTTGDLYVSDMEGTKVERYNKGMEAVQSLNQDKVDAVVIDREPAKVFVSQNEGLMILDEAFTVEQYAIAMKKGNTELVEKVNGALKELKDSGELQKIVDKYITAE